MSTVRGRQLHNRRPDLPDPRIPQHGHTSPRDGGVIAAATSAGTGSSSTSGGTGTSGAPLGSAVPLVESGSGSAGTSANSSREDHVHPAYGGAGSLGWFNVKDYGAVGDGTTDDTAAVNAAVAAADAVSGGTVYFPAGTYKVTSTISCTGRNYRFLGEGDRYGPSVLYMATANTTCLDFSPLSGTGNRDHASLVEHLWVKGPGGGTSGVGINAANDVFVEDCMVSGFYDGVYIKTASYYSRVARTTVTACTRAGIVLDDTNNTTIDACRITGAWSAATAPFGALAYGVYIGCTAPAGLNNRIINTSIEYFTADGVYGSGMLGCEIEACYFESQQSSTGHAHVNLGPSNAAKGVRIASCYFQGDGTAGFSAIAGTTTDRVTVEGCYFGVNSAIGIAASGAGNADWLLVNNYNSPAGTFSLPAATSYTLDPASPPMMSGSAAGGDLSGTYPNPTVAKIKGTALGTLTGAVSGQALVWNGSAWAPATVASTSAGEILVGDTHSTPIIFADLLVTEDGSDLLYAG